MTERECLEVLADPFKSELEYGASSTGNPRSMYIGYTLKERRLELGVELRQDVAGFDYWFIYHARSATWEMIKSRFMNKVKTAKLTMVAQAEIAKSETLQFRIDPQSIKQLYQLSTQKRKRLGTMLREWVLDRLHEETGQGGTLEMRVSRLEKLVKKRSIGG